MGTLVLPSAGTWFITASYGITPSASTVTNSNIQLALSTGNLGSIFWKQELNQNGGNAVTARVNVPTLSYVYVAASSVTLTLYMYAYILPNTITYTADNQLRNFSAIKLA